MRGDAAKAIKKQKSDSGKDMVLWGSISLAQDLMKENLIHFDGEMWMEDVLDKFSGHEERIYPVFDKEQFIGVVSFRHIIEYLLIHKASSKEYNKTRSLVELV